MADIKPTRSELIKLKKQIKLAKSGHSLLKKKRDGLILEFFEILKKAKNVRQEMVASYVDSLHKINMTRTITGDLKLKSIALAVSEAPEVELTKRNIMGVVVPEVKSTVKQKGFLERGFGAGSSSLSIDEAAEAYEQLIEKILVVAEVETMIKRLLSEIEKTKRRVNALEYTVIPKMEGVQKFITFRLEEMEREAVFKTKRIKK